jgi:hypothetical protein
MSHIHLAQAGSHVLSVAPLCPRRVLQRVRCQKGRLPPVLFLQADNCWRENKNWIMFAYLSWLVETGVFQKVHVGFLIVGCARISLFCLE